jgi:hypothetical protein
MANKSHNRDIYIKIPQGKNTEAENKQYNRNTNMNKKLIRLTEGDLHRIVKESVNRVLNEYVSGLDPRTLASLGDKRAAQGRDKQAAQARQAARDTWNARYGYDFDNGNGNYGYQKMGGANQFIHNAGSNYGISSSYNNGMGGGTQNYAYNPQKGTEWHGNGKGESFVQQHEYDPGDNGAHRVADEMENGNGVYKNGRWQ